MTTTKTSRRDFVGSVAAAGTAFTIVPRHVLGGPGYTRAERQAQRRLHRRGRHGRERRARAWRGRRTSYALCDVDDNAADESFRTFPQAQASTATSARCLTSRARTSTPSPVSTPDHNHAAVTMAALRAGKHCSDQKPLTRTINEARAHPRRRDARRPGWSRRWATRATPTTALRTMREWIEAGRHRHGARGALLDQSPDLAAGHRPAHRGARSPPDLRLEPVARPGARAAVQPRPTRRSAGAAGGTSAPARWATWPATCWMPPTGSSTWAIRRASRPRRRSCYAETAPRSSRVTFTYPGQGHPRPR